MKCGDYEIFDRKSKKCVKCPAGYIKRDAYYRRSEVTRRSKKNKATNPKTYVSEACIKSRGLPGKTSLKYRNSGIGPLKKGELGKFGYHHLDTLTKKQRHNSLIDAEKQLGAPKLVRKLGAIRTYLKNTSPKISNIFYQDQKWVRKTYDDKFKGDFKKSALFSK